MEYYYQLLNIDYFQWPFAAYASLIKVKHLAKDLNHLIVILVEKGER